MPVLSRGASVRRERAPWPGAAAPQPAGLQPVLPRCAGLPAPASAGGDPLARVRDRGLAGPWGSRRRTVRRIDGR